MAKLPDELYNETQIGQVLLQGHVINGDDAAKRVQDVADAQAKQPPGQRKLIGQMFVEAGLCSSQDVDAALEVQKNVRGELGHLLEQGKPTDAKTVNELINSSYTEYEKAHPGYHRPDEQHAKLDVPATIAEGSPRVAEVDPTRLQHAEAALTASTSKDGQNVRTDGPETKVK